MDHETTQWRKEVAISRDARGNYHTSFPAEVEEATTDSHDDVPEVVAIDLGIKTLATGINKQGKVYHVGGFNRGKLWYNKQLDKIRSNLQENVLLQ